MPARLACEFAHNCLARLLPNTRDTAENLFIWVKWAPSRLMHSANAAWVCRYHEVGTAFIWGRWTKYVDCSIHGPHLSS